MATRMAMMTMTMRSSMMVKAGVSLLVGLAGALEAVLLCLILVLFIGLILT